MKNLTASLIAAAGQGTEPDTNAWDLRYLYIDTDPSKAWDLAAGNVTYKVSSSASTPAMSLDSTPTAVCFSLDGREMYVAGTTSEDIEQFTLEGAFNIYKGTFTNRISVAAYTTGINGLVFHPNGDKFYISESQYNKLQEWHLTTPWDISSASYYQTFDLTSTSSTNPNDLYISPDGDFLYTIDYNDNYVYQFDFGTKWDISTLSYTRGLSISSQETQGSGISFKGDGSKMYVLGFNGDDVNQYSLNTYWNIFTRVYEKNYSVSSQDTVPLGLYFRPDGGAFFIAGNNFNKIFQYSVGPAEFDISNETTTARGISFKPDGTKMYILDDGSNDITEYTLSTPWDVLSATSPSMVLGTSAYEITPSDLFIKPDGTSVYVAGRSGQDITQWNLTTGWDFTTASYSQRKAVNTQTSQPESVFFSPDGDKMYVGANTGAAIYEYSLNTPWAVSTASYDHSFTSLVDPSCSGISFKPDGSRLYTCGTSTDYIRQWDLTTPWDVSTATNGAGFYTGLSTPMGLFLHPDGNKAYVVDSGRDSVTQFTMT